MRTSCGRRCLCADHDQVFVQRIVVATTLFANTGTSWIRDMRQNGPTRSGTYLVPHTVLFRGPGVAQKQMPCREVMVLKLGANRSKTRILGERTDILPNSKLMQPGELHDCQWESTRLEPATTLSEA